MRLLLALLLMSLLACDKEFPVSGVTPSAQRAAERSARLFGCRYVGEGEIPEVLRENNCLGAWAIRVCAEEDVGVCEGIQKSARFKAVRDRDRAFLNELRKAAGER